MAKLCTAYGLCPLIDQRSLLGVSDDSLRECVIVTIGKNIVIRYKFQDQKQVSSWSTKDKLTSPVIYDTAAGQYVAVFNQNQLRMWTKNEEQLDKVKRYKFQHPIHCVIPQPDGDIPLLLFRSGYVIPLNKALESRKQNVDDPILAPEEVIKDHYFVKCGEIKWVALITQKTKDRACLIVIPIILEESPRRQVLCWKDIGDSFLVGQTVVQKDGSCNLLTLWSDGKLFSYPFLPYSSVNFPGTLLQTLTAVNTNNPVSLIPLSSSHVAVFGADPSEEGAVMILLNLQFQLVQSRLHFKLYSVPPRLWNIGANLLLAVGNNLVVVPYCLEAEQLSTLMGSHTESPAIRSTKWLDSNCISEATLEVAAPSEIKDEIRVLKNKGLPQALILQKLLPLLIDKQEVSAVMWCLKNFSDVPESCLAQTLVFCFSDTGSSGMNLDKSIDKNGDTNVAVDGDTITKTVIPAERFNLLDTVLKVSFSDVSLTPYLRSMPFTITLRLLTHLSLLLEEQSDITQTRVVEWIALLLDSHYQHYLLSHDPQVQSLLTKLHHLVNLQITWVEELKQLVPLLRMLKSGSIPGKQYQLTNKRYCIELLQLY